METGFPMQRLQQTRTAVGTRLTTGYGARLFSRLAAPGLSYDAAIRIYPAIQTSLSQGPNSAADPPAQSADTSHANSVAPMITETSTVLRVNSPSTMRNQ